MTSGHSLSSCQSYCLSFYKIHDHYKKVAEQLRLEKEVALHKYDGNTVIVLVGNVTRVNIGALNYAQSIGDYVVAMHVSLDEDVKKEKEIEQEFKTKFPGCPFFCSAFFLSFN
mgnify:CR=1 FL=1